MKLILWDFDGTLASREGTWAGVIKQILQDIGGDSPNAEIDDISPLLETGYPWHEPHKTHTHIRSAEQWWAWMTPYFEKVFTDLGCDSTLALPCANLVGPTYLDTASWRTYSDVAALGRLTEMGWTHWIVSNHVPELENLVGELGLGAHIAEVFTSALTGYEKPHPQAYRVAIDMARNLEDVLMVGDNFVADYQGPRSIGIPSVLVRNYAEGAGVYAETLWRVVDLIESEHVTTLRG